MVGLIGTFANVGGIIIGTLVGLLLKRGIPKRIGNSIIKAQGIAVIVIGLNGILTAMLSVGAGGKLQVSGTLLLLISLVLGCACGEFLRIEDRLNNVCARVERKIGTSGLARGFITATLIYAIGAMTIVGAINDGLHGDHTVLFTKTALDCITSVVLASSLGIGVMFAALPVLVIQGSIALLAHALAPYVTAEPIRLFSMVGFALVMAIGINFVGNTKIRVANLLPALLIPFIYYYLILQFIMPLFG